MLFPRDVKPITVALAGDGRDESGQQVIKLSGKAEEGGTLTLRWHFKAQ
jgi:hypothetical protein